MQDGGIALVCTTSSSGGGEPYSYTWVDNDTGNIILENSPVITMGTAGNFSVVTTNQAGCVTEDFFTVI